MKTINPQCFQSTVKYTEKASNSLTNTQIHRYQTRKTKALLSMLITQAQYNLQLNSLLEQCKGDLIFIQRALFELLRSSTSRHLLKSNALRLLRQIQKASLTSQ